MEPIAHTTKHTNKQTKEPTNTQTIEGTGNTTPTTNTQHATCNTQHATRIRVLCVVSVSYVLRVVCSFVCYVSCVVCYVSCSFLYSKIKNTKQDTRESIIEWCRIISYDHLEFMFRYFSSVAILLLKLISNEFQKKQ